MHEKFYFAASYCLFSFESILASKVKTLDDEAVLWLQDYLQVDTVNPPGNESRAVEFLRKDIQKRGH